MGSVREPDCYWSDPISDEPPALGLPYGYFVTGVACYGSYCDDKTFHVCRVQGPVDSCMGVCGGQARGGCWCDAECSTYGDCCSDYEPTCVPF